MSDETLARLHAMHDAGEFHVERVEPGGDGHGRMMAFEEISPDMLDALPGILERWRVRFDRNRADTTVEGNP